MNSVHPITLAAITYLIVGAAVVLIHPRLIRDLLPDLRGLDVGAAGFFLKPMMALLVFYFFVRFGQSHGSTRANLRRKSRRHSPRN